MRRWIGTALVAAILVFGSPGFSGPATAASAPQSAPETRALFLQAISSTDVSARRRGHQRHLRKHARHRKAYRPHYIARPSHYRPDRRMSPFFPFGLGYGLEPSW